MAETTNDNDNPRGGRRANPPDAHGEAAILLVESLLHGLIARSVISLADAVEIVEAAADAKEEIAFELGANATTRQTSIALLDSIRASLSHDLPRD
ncbi:hypothetical protein [Sphingomonas sp. TDK1]|uniref:hypothetical protein n=1 Tax=Sphingomonas sp. TDK1 TaxID=453247 RepID=UPI0007D9457A|nr:hypothetical protein [Sphingomonas sp. TDK1]OAN67106.1 hypothetical protein A7X12_00285 [Sphingomonas sp. TDK1]